MTSCAFWVKKRQRTCRNTPASGSRFCNVHQHASECEDCLTDITVLNSSTNEINVEGATHQLQPLLNNTTIEPENETVTQKQEDETFLKHFTYHQDATDYARELLGAEHDVGDGVKVIKLSKCLQPNEALSPFLVTRESSRALWHEVYNYITSSRHYHAVVTGTPGIGKSRSMMYLLRLLLQAKKKVFYEPRKTLAIYAFIPTSSGYKAYTIPRSEMPKYAMVLLCDPDSYLLIDPDVPSPITEVFAHTVVACSPSSEYYRQFIKRMGTEMFYMPLWSREEIRKLFSFMPTLKLTPETLDFLYEIYGGNPRMLLKGRNQDSLVDLNSKINALDITLIYKLLVSPHSVATLENSQRSISELFGYQTGPPFTRAETTMRVASNYIKSRICSKYWSEIMNRLNLSSEFFVKSSLERFFEATTASAVLENGGTFKRKNLETNTIDTITLGKVLKTVEISTWEKMAEYVGKMHRCSHSSVRTILAKPAAANQPAIEYADASDRVYQVTLNTDHGVITEHIAKLIELAGLDEENKLHLYFVIPEHMFQQYPAQEYRGEDAKSKNRVRKVVTQYALAVPDQMPSGFDTKDALYLEEHLTVE